MAELNPGGASDMSHAIQKRNYERVSSSDAVIVLSTSTHRGKRLMVLTDGAEIQVPTGLATDFECSIVSYGDFTITYSAGVTFNNQTPTTISVSPPSLNLPSTVVLDASPDYGADDYLLYGSSIVFT